MEILYFDTLTYAQGDMYVVASDKGLVYIGTPNASFDEVQDWAKNPLKDIALKRVQKNCNHIKIS